jgi:hypothetical protein
LLWELKFIFSPFFSIEVGGPNSKSQTSNLLC